MVAVCCVQEILAGVLECRHDCASCLSSRIGRLISRDVEIVFSFVFNVLVCIRAFSLVYSHIL